jgi:hypothetical protein
MDGSSERPLENVISYLELQCSTCSHCGTQGEGFKRCSRCKESSYCSAECQTAAWKRHKKTCAPPLLWQKVLDKMDAAHAAGDWQEVLKWGWRVDELLGWQPDDWGRKVVLTSFITAHKAALSATLSKEHASAPILLLEQLVILLGKMQRFADQGEAMCEMGKHLLFLSRQRDAASWFVRAREIAAANGFFFIECNSCMGLGRVAMVKGHHEEGLALLRNALVAAPLNELDDPKFELAALEALIRACFETHAFEEVAQLVLRYRAVAQTSAIVAASGIDESFTSIYFHLDSLYYSARLQEVLSF